MGQKLCNVCNGEPNTPFYCSNCRQINFNPFQDNPIWLEQLIERLSAYLPPAQTPHEKELNDTYRQALRDIYNRHPFPHIKNFYPNQRCEKCGAPLPK